MKQFLIAAATSFLFCILTAPIAYADIVINELSPSSSTEWIELINTDTNNAVSLSGYTLADENGTAYMTLSGSIPKQAMLTFAFPTGSLNDEGACVVVLDDTLNGIGSLSYGSATCPGEIPPHYDGTVNGTQSIANISNGEGGFSYQAVSPATKGWCNDSYGGCPSIASIVSALNAAGVTTNLGDQSDYTRTTGLYFEKEGTGKITFLSEINFTDQSSLSWLSTLDSKLSMSSGTIGLDADLIKNLVSTNAQLTMYNLTLNNPEVYVDGAPDSGGVVSGLSYNGGTLTFTAAHFTTFTARERSSSTGGSSTTGSSTSSPTTPGCGNTPPDHAPDLFQINTFHDSVRLYFSPVNNAVSYYYIAYGFSEGDERFGVSFSQGPYDGVLNYHVGALYPNTPFYFKVRAGNGCAPGPWSAWMKAVPGAEDIYFAY